MVSAPGLPRWYSHHALLSRTLLYASGAESPLGRTTMFKTRHLLDAIDASGHAKMQQAFWRARLMDPEQTFFDEFSQPPQVLYKYVPAHRLDHALPDEKPCSFRATPPNELNDINEVNYKTTFVDDEKNRENINREYAMTLTELFPPSPLSAEDVERYRQKYPRGYGAALTCDQLSKRYGVTSFSTRRNDVTMWSHYADNCRGVVIGFNVDLWVRHLHGTSVIRQVKYADDLPLARILQGGLILAVFGLMTGRAG